MMQPRVEGLYAITPDVADTADLVTMTQQVLAGGARLIQYRNKTADVALRLKQAHALVNLCQKFNVPLIINDHPDLAVEVGAEGVHIGQGDASITEVRRRLGPGKIIGVSCYNRLESAIRAERQGADYVAFGAFFISVTKPGAETASIDLLSLAKQKLHVPLVAIGGITPCHAIELICLGADAIAASNALFRARNIQSAAKHYSRLFKQTRHSIHHTYELSHDFT